MIQTIYFMENRISKVTAVLSQWVTVKAMLTVEVSGTIRMIKSKAICYTHVLNQLE